MLYDTFRGPATYNTLQELALILVWRVRQTVSVAQTRAHAQAALGGEKALDAFTDYRDLVNQIDNESRDMKFKEKLEKLKEIKEIRFKPMVSLRRSPQLKVFDKGDVL